MEIRMMTFEEYIEESTEEYKEECKDEERRIKKEKKLKVYDKILEAR